MFKSILNIISPMSFEEKLVQDISIMIRPYVNISVFKIKEDLRAWITDKIRSDIFINILTIEVTVFKCCYFKILILIQDSDKIITLTTQPKYINLLDKQILEQLEETSECILSFK